MLLTSAPCKTGNSVPTFRYIAKPQRWGRLAVQKYRYRITSPHCANYQKSLNHGAQVASQTNYRKSRRNVGQIKTCCNYRCSACCIHNRRISAVVVVRSAHQVVPREVPSDVTAHRVINTLYCVCERISGWLRSATDCRCKPNTQHRGNAVLCCFSYQRYATVDAEEKNWVFFMVLL